MVVLHVGLRTCPFSRLLEKSQPAHARYYATTLWIPVCTKAHQQVSSYVMYQVCYPRIPSCRNTADTVKRTALADYPAALFQIR